MAESPLFKSLPIGSLRYWCNNVEITETKIYENVKFELTNKNMNFELSGKTYNFDLLSSRYTLQLQPSTELLDSNERITFKVCT